jgi:hypothetical protein
LSYSVSILKSDHNLLLRGGVRAAEMDEDAPFELDCDVLKLDVEACFC